MTTNVFQIIATHFPFEFEHYGIEEIQEHGDDMFSFVSKIHVPINMQTRIINFLKIVQEAENNKVKAFKIKTQIQNFGEFELNYDTLINALGEELYTEVKSINSFFIRPCDILEVRAEIARIFEKYALDEDKNHVPFD